MFGKHKVALVRIGIAALLAVAGMGQSAIAQSADGTGASGAAVPGGTLTIALSDYSTRGLNPHATVSWGDGQVLRNAYDSLVAQDDDENFQPWLAKSWTVSEDGLVYEFALRDDVTFHDGEKFDAAAVKANIATILDPKYPANADVGINNYSSVTSVDVVSDYVVRITLGVPRADFLSTLASVGGAIISPKALADPANWESESPTLPGSGPFVLQAAVPGQELRFVKNPDYGWAPATAHHQGPAYLDELVVKYVPDGATRAGLLTSGEVGAIGGVEATDIDLFKDAEGFHYEEKGTNLAPYLLYLNVTSAPTSDIRVRQALTIGTDLDAIVHNVTRGTQHHVWSIISETSPYYDPRLEKAHPFDKGKAEALLADAGWGTVTADGVRTNDAGEPLAITVLATNPPYPLRDVLEAWQAELLQNLGIAVKLNFVENPLVYDLIAANTYNVFPRQVGGTDLSLQLNRALGSSTAAGPSRAVDGITLGSVVAGAKLSEPGVDQLLLAATKATDKETRKKIFGEIADYVAENAIAIPLFNDRYSVAAASSVHDVSGFLNAPQIDGVTGASWVYDTWVDP